MRIKRSVIVALAAFLLVALAVTGYAVATNGIPVPENPERLAELGEFLYFDENLSGPQGQSCASCHHPDAGFDDPDEDLPVSEGVIPHRFGDRNSPMSAYAMYAPAFYFDEGEGLWIGGQFWDGRATGDVLGDPLADQAIGPPLNPVEMANPNKRTYVLAIKNSEYAELFEHVWGGGPKFWKDVETVYDQAGLSVAAFERTELFASFSSKYDYYLDQCLEAGGSPGDCAMGIGEEAAEAGEIFTEQEWAGFLLFMNDVNNNDGVFEEGEGAMCVLCHIADWTTTADYDLPVVVPDWVPDDDMVPPLFTDFTFDNLGVPKNWDNPFLYMPPNLNPDGVERIDWGLGATLKNMGYGPEVYTDEFGKFKVMTLRNLGATAPYSHNGLFATLLDITHFYNTRDDAAAGWDMPEVPATVNTEELGNLGLSPEQEAALVAFMETLTDGYEGWGE